jgi:hypothetical protein
MADSDSLNPLDDERFQDVSAAARGDEDAPPVAEASSEEDETSQEHWEPLMSNGYHSLSGSLSGAALLKGRNAAAAGSQRKTLPVVLGIVGVVVILGCLGIGALVTVRLISLQNTLNSPQVTIDTFYSALHVNDYQTAYNQLSSGFQQRYTFPSFRATFELIGTLASYQISNLQTRNNQASATVKVTLVKGDGGTTVDEIKNVQLVQENGDWKIDRVNPSMSLVIWFGQR